MSLGSEKQTSDGSMLAFVRAVRPLAERIAKQANYELLTQRLRTRASLQEKTQQTENDRQDAQNQCEPE